VKALSDFKEGRVGILVATDIAARGLDIEQLPHVVNYELPMVPEDYVHRIGRTGRAGVDGQAISLVCVDETPLLRAIQGLLKKQIASEVIPGFEPDSRVRPEPIRLRSTPAERRQLATEREERQGVAGTRPASRPGTPARHAGAAREESSFVAAPRRPGPRGGRAGAPAGRPDARQGGGRRHAGRGQGSGTPGTGFGNAAPARAGGGTRHDGRRSAQAGRPDGASHADGGRRGPGAARPAAHGRPASQARPAGGHTGGGPADHAGGHAGAHPGGGGSRPRALPGERIQRLGSSGS
jgi:ATP-dependent RNA helicase RhlE